MELKQYAAEHIIENGKHYPEKWVNRYFIEVADAQRALDAEREKVKELEAELEEYRSIAEQQGANKAVSQLATLQAQLAAEQHRADRAVQDRRDALDVKTKEGMSCSEWLMRTATAERQVNELKAQLRQVEGQSKQQAEEAVIVFAKYTTLGQLVEALPVVDGRMDVECGACYYIRSFVAGQYGIVCGLITEQSTAMAIKALLEYRATLAAQDAKDAPLTAEQRDIRDCCEKPHDCKWGGLGGCGYEGRKP